MTPVLRSAAPTDDIDFSFRPPRVADGTRLWEIARDSRVLDVNSSYSYVLWCRDFFDTSVVAVDANDRPVGFVTGYLRPGADDSLFVWQVAVDSDQRGHGLAVRMLQGLLERTTPRGARRLETTISPDNIASIALFTSLARRRDTTITRRDLFAAADFPDSHEPEDLYTVGPFDGTLADTSDDHTEGLR